jgi:hypothetical protein
MGRSLGREWRKKSKGSIALNLSRTPLKVLDTMLGRILRRTSSRASSRRSMSVDSQESPSPVSNPSPSASQSQGKILTTDVHLHIRRGQEKERYEKLKKRSFVLTPMFCEEFMQEAGLDSEFSQIFALLGWTSFYNTSKRGSRLLTLEFLPTLKSSNDGVTFWLFRQEHTLS